MVKATILLRLLERHQRFVRIAAFALCTLFAVRAMADVMDAIGEADAADTVARPAARPAAPARGGRTAARSPALTKSGAALAERNIFCSSCQPAAPAAVATPAAPTGIPPATSLPLRLIATHVSADAPDAPDAAGSSAMVLHDATGSQGAYRMGDRIPGAGPVVRIGGRSIDFENPAAGRVERLAIPDRPAAPAAPAAETEAPVEDDPAQGRRPRRGVDPEMQARLDAGVKVIDETTFEVDRKLVEDVLARPQAAARGARVVPRKDGLRVFGVRPDSAHARLGLKSGDVIHSVNGIDLSSPDKMLEAITKLRNESSIALSITRRGAQVTLNYRVR